MIRTIIIDDEPSAVNVLTLLFLLWKGKGVLKTIRNFNAMTAAMSLWTIINAWKYLREKEKIS